MNLTFEVSKHCLNQREKKIVRKKITLKKHNLNYKFVNFLKII